MDHFNMDIDGKTLSKQIRNAIREEVKILKGRKPYLAVILVGKNPASQIYTNRKVKACKEAGMQSKLIQLPDSISQQELIDHIEQLNKNSEVDGILVQLPLPPQIDPDRIAETVCPEKDVDGFHPINLGKLLLGNGEGFIPCTPLGIRKLIEHYKIETSGKHIVILGRSNIVGKPLAALLMHQASYGNATVTIANSRTKNLSKITQQADILIAAIGKPKFIKKSMIKRNAIVIDVGINRLDDSSLAGDVDYADAKEHCSMITPVPGGVGPMTIAMLLHNTLKSYRTRV